MRKTPARLTAGRSPRAMARRMVRSLTPRIAAASRADRGHVSAAPDTSLSPVLSADRSSMVGVASATETAPRKGGIGVARPAPTGHGLAPGTSAFSDGTLSGAVAVGQHPPGAEVVDE